MLLAQELVARFHSQAAAEAALADFEARFKQNAIPDDLPEVTVQTGEGGVLAIGSDAEKKPAWWPPPRKPCA